MAPLGCLPWTNSPRIILCRTRLLLSQGFRINRTNQLQQVPTISDTQLTMPMLTFRQLMFNRITSSVREKTNRDISPVQNAKGAKAPSTQGGALALLPLRYAYGVHCCTFRGKRLHTEIHLASKAVLEASTTITWQHFRTRLKTEQLFANVSTH